MAYIGDDKVVLFGGNISGISNDETWIDDQSAKNWNQMSPSSKPSKRDHQGMAYLGSDKVLLFGGFNHQTLDIYGDTWVFDLSENNWTQKSPTTNPSERYNQGMAYIGEDQVLIFGGWDESTYFNDTWVYDLSNNS